MICGVPALVSATNQEANWSKFSFCLVMYQFKRRSATSDASSVFKTP